MVYTLWGTFGTSLCCKHSGVEQGQRTGCRTSGKDNGGGLRPEDGKRTTDLTSFELCLGGWCHLD